MNDDLAKEIAREIAMGREANQPDRVTAAKIIEIFKRWDIGEGVTEEQIEAARTPAGGWTREQLAEWGVPWPPPKGWKSELLKSASGSKA